VQIPTNKPMIRVDQPDLVYKTESAKWDAVVEDINERFEKGQPVLVGTVSVEKSEHLSGLLKRKGIPHEVLNAKQHAREAAVVAMAGRKGQVTVATNMAGRGTDIMLGGNVEFLAHEELERRGLNAQENPEEYEAAWTSALEAATAAAAAEHDEVTSLGGLYVLGTERHESRRIDNQLRGRSGRQGDPGESRFYLSLGDDLMRLFKAAVVEQVLTRLNVPEDVPIESKMVSRAIQSAQSQVEQQNFEIRKNVLKYDEVLNRQRMVIYDERRRVLHGEDLRDQVLEFIEETIDGYITAETGEAFSEDWDLEKLWAALRQLYPVGITPADIWDEDVPPDARDIETLREKIKDDAFDAYDAREEALGEEVMREIERRVVLSVLDRKWREHLYEMDYLREGIGLRAMAQRDPLVEYQREGFELFTAMMEAIREESVGYIFNVEVQLEETPAEDGSSNGEVDHPHISAKGLDAPERPSELTYTAPSIDGDGEIHIEAGTADFDLDSEDDEPAPGKQNRAERRAQKRANKGR
jgi:preprotein translocase subunit SecA